MNTIKAMWNDRTNILQLLNTLAIMLVAYVLWSQKPAPTQSIDFSSELGAQTDSINKLTTRLDQPLTIQSESFDKLIKKLEQPIAVTVSNETDGVKGLLQNKVPFEVQTTIEGKINTTVEGGSELSPLHVSKP